jgi:sugar phosphate isomerase/epimerase
MYPISVQLYSLRGMMQAGYEKEDFVQVLKWVADIGYKGVEPAGFWGFTPKEFKRITDDLGLEISSSHSPWFREPEQIQEIVDTAGELGLRTACCGFGPNDFKSPEDIKRTAGKVNKLRELAAQNGLTLFQHNHAWEFAKLDGRYAYDIYLELCPDIKFEIDAYWSANHGANDPVEMVRRFRDRCILMHVKDGTFRPEIPMLPLGTGKMDIPAVIAAADPAVNKWVIVELDNCVIDMNYALKLSYRYMVSNGICAGNK